MAPCLSGGVGRVPGGTRGAGLGGSWGIAGAVPGGNNGGWDILKGGGLIPGWGRIGGRMWGGKKKGGGPGGRIPGGGRGIGGGINIGGGIGGGIVGGGMLVCTGGAELSSVSARLKKLFCNSVGGRGKVPGRPGTGSNSSTIGSTPSPWDDEEPCRAWERPHFIVSRRPPRINLLNVRSAACSAAEREVNWINAHCCRATNVIDRISPYW